MAVRAIDGPLDSRKAVTEALYSWTFKPSSVNGQPVQMGSAVQVDLLSTPPVVQVAKPMTAVQLSPAYYPKCFIGLMREELTSLEACQQQLDALLRDSQSTPSDRFTAYDQYGLVLLKYAHDPKKALEQFSKAIELPSQRLNSMDAEWAYAHWHRAISKQELGNSADAEKDFGIAENSLREVESSIGDEKIAAYYHELVGRIASRRVAP